MSDTVPSYGQDTGDAPISNSTYAASKGATPSASDRAYDMQAHADAHAIKPRHSEGMNPQSILKAVAPYIPGAGALQRGIDKEKQGESNEAKGNAPPHN
jgi:hypothetical protein